MADPITRLNTALKARHSSPDSISQTAVPNALNPSPARSGLG